MIFTNRVLQLAGLIESLDTEIPDTGKPFDWEDYKDLGSGDYSVDFNINEEDYVVHFFQVINDYYEISFSKRTGTGLYKGAFATFEVTNDAKNSQSVFGIISKIVLKFLNDFQPTSFFFSAKEKSRVKLYDTFTKIIERKTNYKYKGDSEKGGYKVYQFELTL